MPTEALVCPACRTWVEGSGRVVKCPACGTRFHASDARLDARTPAASPAPTQDGPTFESIDRKTEPATSEPMRWPSTEEAARSVPEEVHHTGVDGASDGEAPANPDLQERRNPVNLSMLFTLAFLALIFIGNRVLSGELMIVALIALIGAQWLLRRHERGES